jgi:hypothetical protein
MVQDELVSDLEVIDYLELFNSTVESSRMLQISQSSCSRRYRSFSQAYGIGFDRVADRYQATSNFDVLACFRQASQKLRVRRGAPRICIGWQLGDVPISGLDQAGVVIPIRPMNTWKLLSLLEQRLVDLALMGLMEFEGMLGHPLSSLRARRMTISPTMLCVPLSLYNLQLLAHLDHPLQGCTDFNADDLSLYPSPALPLGMAPALIGALQSQGLASQSCGLQDYNEQAWEGFAADGVGLSYGAPHRLPSLSSRFKLEPLAYELGIRECIGVVGHRDVLSDSGFSATFTKILPGLRQALSSNATSMQWLS